MTNNDLISILVISIIFIFNVVLANGNYHYENYKMSNLNWFVAGVAFMALIAILFS